MNQSIEYHKLLGEYIGTLKGILANEIQNDLKIKLEKLLKELVAKNKSDENNRKGSN